MRRLEIRHATTPNLIYVSKRTRLDNFLERSGFSRSDKTGFKDFDERFFISVSHGNLLSQSEVRRAILSISELANFRSLEFRPEVLRLTGPANDQRTEERITHLATLVGSQVGAQIGSQTESRSTPVELEVAKKIFDLYSPPNWLVGLPATGILSAAILATSIWLSENFVRLERSLSIFIAFNSFLFIAICFALKSKIRELRLPARAFVLHGISTFLLVIFCGAGFEVFANFAFDSSEPTEISVPVISKTTDGKIGVRLPHSDREIFFQLNENQSAKVTLGHSTEVLGVHRGLLLQPWFQAKRLEY